MRPICISQWGIDFRPDYLVLATIKAQLRPTATLALTATANDRVRQDILNKLALKNAAQIMTSVDRPNIYLGVSQQPDEQAKNQFLASLVQKAKVPDYLFFKSAKDNGDCEPFYNRRLI